MKFDADILQVKSVGKDKVIVTLEIDKKLMESDNSNNYFYRVHTGFCNLIPDV
jgi:hypothetical protein